MKTSSQVARQPNDRHVADEARPLRIAVVCDYTSVHAKIFVDYFAADPARYCITVISTRFAESTEGVCVINLQPATRPPRSPLATAAYELLYPWLIRRPRILNRLWSRALLAEADSLSGRLHEVMHDLRPDVIHALRVQPEGLLALDVARAWPNAKLAVSIWGQDLVLFGKAHGGVRRATADVMRRVDLLLPDTARDECLARDEFDLNPGARSLVIPGPGGLRIDELSTAASLPETDAERWKHPRILTVRGFDSGYIRLKLLLEAHRRVLLHVPDAELVVVTPANERRELLVRRWIAQLGLASRVTLLPGRRPRSELFEQMKRCEVNLFAAETDGLAMTLLESMYFGQVAVVANRSCYVPPLVHGQNAVLFREFSAESIAAAVVSAIRLSGHRDKIAASNRMLIEAQYSRNANLSKVGQMYFGMTTNEDAAAARGTVAGPSMLLEQRAAR